MLADAQRRAADAPGAESVTGLESSVAGTGAFWEKLQVLCLETGSRVSSPTTLPIGGQGRHDKHSRPDDARAAEPPKGSAGRHLSLTRERGTCLVSSSWGALSLCCGILRFLRDLLGQVVRLETQMESARRSLQQVANMIAGGGAGQAAYLGSNSSDASPSSWTVCDSLAALLLRAPAGKRALSELLSTVVDLLGVLLSVGKASERMRMQRAVLSAIGENAGNCYTSWGAAALSRQRRLEHEMADALHGVLVLYLALLVRWRQETATDQRANESTEERAQQPSAAASPAAANVIHERAPRAILEAIESEQRWVMHAQGLCQYVKTAVPAQPRPLWSQADVGDVLARLVRASLSGSLELVDDGSGLCLAAARAMADIGHSIECCYSDCWPLRDAFPLFQSVAFDAILQAALVAHVRSLISVALSHAADSPNAEVAVLIRGLHAMLESAREVAPRLSAAFSDLLRKAVQLYQRTLLTDIHAWVQNIAARDAALLYPQRLPSAPVSQRAIAVGAAAETLQSGAPLFRDPRLGLWHTDAPEDIARILKQCVEDACTATLVLSHRFVGSICDDICNTYCEVIADALHRAGRERSASAVPYEGFCAVVNNLRRLHGYARQMRQRSERAFEPSANEAHAAFKPSLRRLDAAALSVMSAAAQHLCRWYSEPVAREAAATPWETWLHDSMTIQSWLVPAERSRWAVLLRAQAQRSLMKSIVEVIRGPPEAADRRALASQLDACDRFLARIRRVRGQTPSVFSMLRQALEAPPDQVVQLYVQLLNMHPNLGADTFERLLERRRDLAGPARCSILRQCEAADNKMQRTLRVLRISRRRTGLSVDMESDEEVEDARLAIRGL
eukprot:ctg_129.g86